MKNISRFLFSLVVMIGLVPLRSFASEDTLFLQKARKILKSSATLYENQGVSVGLSGSGVAGAGIAVEAINLKGKVSFFCSSSVSLKVENSAGFSSDFGYVATRGCDVPGQYEGLFVSLTGYSGLDVGAKGAIGAAVSYGFNSDTLKLTLKENFIKNPKNFLSLLQEIKKVSACLGYDAGSKMIKFFLHLILKNLQTLKESVSDPFLREEISLEIARTKDLLDNQALQPSCGFQKVSENIKNSKKLYFEYALESAKYKTLASVLPTRDQLALFVDNTFDPQNFPFLRQLLFDIFRNGMSGCDSLSTLFSLGLGANATGVGPSMGFGMALSNYTKIGDTFDIRELRDNNIDRYVQNKGLKNLASDVLGGSVRVCTAAGKCVWKAACMLKDREAFSLGVNKIQSACTESTKRSVAFLNGMYQCFKGNFKELVKVPVDVSSKFGDEP